MYTMYYVYYVNKDLMMKSGNVEGGITNFKLDAIFLYNSSDQVLLTFDASP